jgi:hypothetical protein
MLIEARRKPMSVATPGGGTAGNHPFSVLQERGFTAT